MLALVSMFLGLFIPRSLFCVGDGSDMAGREKPVFLHAPCVSYLLRRALLNCPFALKVLNCLDLYDSNSCAS